MSIKERKVSFEMQENQTTVRLALIDGEQVCYDYCSPDKDDLKGFLLGKGTIHTINGVEQKCPTKEYYFYLRV